MRQSTVLIWSGLEVLASDTFVKTVNASPALVTRLCTDEVTKKVFQMKSVAFETLSEHGFDLSRRMGDVLSRIRSIDTVQIMRPTFRALWPDAAQLHELFGDSILWVLNQRRHLIVHRRGVIDRDYIENTGEKLAIGQELVVSAPDVEAYLRAVVRVGSELLLTANRSVQ